LVANGIPEKVHAHMEHVNRQIKLILLDAIEEDGWKDAAPVLQDWFELEMRKMCGKLSIVH